MVFLVFDWSRTSLVRVTPQRTEGLDVVPQVLYLIFNERYTTSSGPGQWRN
jgi:predicted RNA polymerase sigma factor